MYIISASHVVCGSFLLKRQRSESLLYDNALKELMKEKSALATHVNKIQYILLKISEWLTHLCIQIKNNN